MPSLHRFASKTILLPPFRSNEASSPSRFSNRRSNTTQPNNQNQRSSTTKNLVAVVNMFRFLQSGQQAFKVVLRPTSVKFHTIPLAYSSLQTHGTIARYFSSSSKVDAWEYHVNQHRREVENRLRHWNAREPIINSGDFDASVSNIDHKVLETTIAERLGIPYLSKATKPQAKEVVSAANGYIHLEGLKPIIPLVVSRGAEACWVFFLIDTAASATYLSGQACEHLGLSKGLSGVVCIGGRSHTIYPSPAESRFSDISILGGDFCEYNLGRLWCDYVTGRVTLCFGRDWEPVKKPKL